MASSGFVRRVLVSKVLVRATLVTLWTTDSDATLTLFIGPE